MGGASVGPFSPLRSGAVTLTWTECVTSSDTCRARWISEGKGDVRLSLPLSRMFVIRAKPEGEISYSDSSGNMARRRSRVDIWDSRRSGGRAWVEVMVVNSSYRVREDRRR